MTTTPRIGFEIVDPANPQIEGIGRINANFLKADTMSGYVWTLSTARPEPPDTFPGMLIYETDTKRRYARNVSDNGWSVVGGDTFDSRGKGAVRAVRPSKAFGLDGTHSAFPCVAYSPTGEIILVYRQGSDHSANRDGVIMLSRSFDNGHNWTEPVVSVNTVLGVDLRDPGVSLSNDSETTFLTYFKGTTANGAAGVFFRSSADGGVTWNPEVRVDDGIAAAASSAPVVQLNDNTLVFPYYGWTTGESRYSVWVAKSVDGGITWANTRVHNGETDGVSYPEPWIALQGTTAVMGFRWNTQDGIAVSTSVDNTVTWTAPLRKFTGSGRPSLLWLNDDTIAMVYRRSSSGQGHTLLRYSRDNGATWYPQKMVEPALWAEWMTYGSAVRIGNGVSFLAFAQEQGNTSHVRFTYITEAGGNTPYGQVASDFEDFSSNIDDIMFATRFAQPDGVLAYPWSVNGSVTVTNGELIAQSLGAAEVDIAYVSAGYSECEVEAEMKSTGTLVGHGIIFRMLDVDNYLYFVVESADPRNYRFYKVVGGVTTLTAGVSGTTAGINPYPINRYHRFKVVCRANHAWAFMNDQFILSTPTDGAFLSRYQVGLRLNSQSGVTNSCRRFVARGIES